MTEPQIVSREGWGARAPLSPLSPWPSGQPTGNDAHYEGSGGQPDHANCAAEVRSIQAFHQSGARDHYIDIAYNDCLCQHGVIFQGRDGFRFESAAQSGGNPFRRSICYLGGPSTPFTPAAQASLAWYVANGPAATRGNLQGHKDEPSCSTSCPGDAIENFIRSGAWRNAPAPTPHPQPAPAPLPLPPAGVSHPVLRLHSLGPAVMELQRKMNGVAGTHLALDGDFGPRTFTAVENFQAFFKLGADGIAGPKTWGMLDYCAALHGIH